jgi:hypothetical protein
MGNYYQNVTIKGASTASVTDLMRELGRPAYIAAAADDVTVVFDAGLDEMRNPQDMLDVPATLSVRLSCPVLLAGVFDDDLLYLALYEGLEKTFEYTSSDRTARNLSRLCAAFDRSHAFARVWFILKLPHFIPYLFESFRHLHLLRALGLPDWAFATGYRTIERNPGRPDGVAPDALIRV